ncbi:Frataxin, partial [Rozella allomycis CSF55]
LSNRTLENLNDQMEEIIDANDRNCDIEYTNGVLTMKLRENMIFVLNKQPPNRQIWLSSPISGPRRFDFCESNNTWFYTRDNSTLHELLSKELSEILGKQINI